MSQELQRAFGSMREAEAQVQEEFDALRTENQALREALVTSNRDLRTAKETLTDQAVELQQLLDTKRSHINVIQQLQAATTNHADSLRASADENAQLRRDLDAARESNAQLQRIINRTEREAHDSEARRLGLLVSYDEATKELSRLANDAQALQYALAEARDQVRVGAEAREDFEAELVLYTVRHTMYQYGTVPPDDQAERIAADVLHERENIRNILLARKAVRR